VRLANGVVEVELGPERTGDIAFVWCGMNMLRGTIVVR
jgi:plastocyanin domain-containing protein